MSQALGPPRNHVPLSLAGALLWDPIHLPRFIIEPRDVPGILLQLMPVKWKILLTIHLGSLDQEPWGSITAAPQLRFLLTAGSCPAKRALLPLKAQLMCQLLVAFKVQRNLASVLLFYFLSHGRFFYSFISIRQ